MRLSRPRLSINSLPKNSRLLTTEKRSISDSLNEEKTIDLHSYTVEGQAVSLISSIDRRLPTQVLKVEVLDTERIKVRKLDGFW